MGAARRSFGESRFARRASLAMLALFSAWLLAPGAAPASAAAASFELSSIHAPTNVPRKASTNEVLTLSYHANVGKFALDFENEETGEAGTTALLPFDAKAEQVQRALEDLRHGEPKSAVGAGNVKVEGGYDAATETGTYTIEFRGALGERYIEALLEIEGEISSHEEAKFEREEEKRVEEEEARGEKPREARLPEEPEGEAAQITTPGYHDFVDYRLNVADRGAAPTNGPITLRDKLPAGLLTRELPSGPGWICGPSTAGKSEAESEKERRQEEKRDKEEKRPEGSGLGEFECTYGETINPDGAAPSIGVEGYLDIGQVQEGGSIENTASVSGGGSGEVAVHEAAKIDSAPTEFGLQAFTAATTGPAGETYTQAGGHPYAATTGLFFNTVPRLNPGTGATEVAVSGRVKDALVTLPAGFLGNPLWNSEPEQDRRCSQADFTRGVPGGPEPGESCPADSQVGTADVYLGDFQKAPAVVAVYDLVPPAGVPAEFGFIFEHVPVRLDARVLHEASPYGGEYRVAVLSADVNEAFNVFAVQLTLWGSPAEPSHKEERFKNLTERGAEYEGEEKPFLINPTDCLAEADALEPGSSLANLAPVTSAVVDSWEHQGALDPQGNPLYPGTDWSSAQAESPPVSGCGALEFHPSISFAPRTEEEEDNAPAGTTQAEAPSGYKFELTIPQKEKIGELATPELRDTSVTLPEGLVLSPAGANGLVACKASEIDVESTERGSCPQASQVGSVTIQSQLLEKPLSGRVYVGEPECHPCDGAQVQEGKLLKLYIEAEEAGAPANAGVRVKLRGSASVNQGNGRITTTFENNPQTPFEKLTLKLRGGPRAALANPATCGEGFVTDALLTPWSDGGTTPGGALVEGTQPAAVESGALSITGCPSNLPFNPSFNAGTQTSSAGAYSSFTVTFSRRDGEQTLSGVSVTTPPGLLGKIAGIPRCEGLAAESSQVECSAASQIGTATSAAGAGSEPYVVSGPVYLTGGYKGAPFGLKIAVPANAGPFELGKVVVRAAININKTTSQITVTSDPLPQSIDGIPFRLKAVKVEVNRPEFMFNPTNCEKQTVSAALSGQPARPGEAAVAASESAPFTATGCGALGFAPALTATTEGKTSKQGGASLDVKVAQHHGEANIRKVELELPEALPSRQTTLNQACPEKTFEENPAGCDEGSFVGMATAYTPLLSVPLTGPAILVSHGGLAFPDLVFLLQGEGVHIELVGNTDIRKIDGREITFSKFEAVPDAPIESFETDLPEGPHSALAAYGEFCAKKELFSPTTITAQNGARYEQVTRIAVTGCPPSVAITRKQVKGAKLLLTVKLSQAGSVKITGNAIKEAKRSLAAGTSTLTFALTRAGRGLARRHKKITVSVTLSAAKQQVTTHSTFKA